MPSPRYSDQQIIDALRQTNGMVYLAADALGCSPNTIKARLARSAKLRAVQSDARGRTLDTTEQKLFDAIQNREPWAIQFYLKTQGKERGYVERQEMTGKGGGPVETSATHEHTFDHDAYAAIFARVLGGDAREPGSGEAHPGHGLG